MELIRKYKIYKLFNHCDVNFLNLLNYLEKIINEKNIKYFLYENTNLYCNDNIIKNITNYNFDKYSKLLLYIHNITYKEKICKNIDLLSNKEISFTTYIRNTNYETFNYNNIDSVIMESKLNEILLKRKNR